MNEGTACTVEREQGGFGVSHSFSLLLHTSKPSPSNCGTCVKLQLRLVAKAPFNVAYRIQYTYGVPSRIVSFVVNLGKGGASVMMKTQ